VIINDVINAKIGVGPDLASFADEIILTSF